MDLQESLYGWAEETVSAYKQIALQLKNEPCSKYTAFYTQSNLACLSDYPQLVILAINPNSTCSYEDQVSNTYWRLDPERGMTATRFLDGNPDFPNRNKWKLWNRLTRILRLGGIANLIETEGSFVYANIVNFNSPHPQDIPREVFNQCAKHSFSLIELLHPKFIICLGKDPFTELAKHSGATIETIIPGEVERLYLKGSVVVRIPHTSKFGYTSEEMAMVGKALAVLFYHPEYDSLQIRSELKNEIESFEFRRKGKKNSSNTQSVDPECTFLKYEPVDIQHHRYLFGSHLELTVAIRQGFVGIRHLIRHGNYLKSTEQNEEEIREILKKFRFNVEKTQVNCAWLGKKALNEFGKNHEEVIQNIQYELRQIEYQVNQLNWNV